MAIATGGAVPEGADAVVPIEVVEESAEGVTVRAPVRGRRERSRPRAATSRRARACSSPGVVLGPGQVGALAAAGVAEVRCAKRPRVGILVTGSELRQPGEELGPGQIYESNGLLLATALAARRRRPRAARGRRRRPRRSIGARWSARCSDSTCS